VLLYALIFAMPLTGWMMSSAKNYPVSWFKLFQWPDLVQPSEALFSRMNDLHHWLFYALVAVAALHIAGALKHAFIDKNDVLKRMLPFGGAD
jgi:cytochrome b561